VTQKIAKLEQLVAALQERIGERDEGIARIGERGSTD
jgi:hypothetical protein